MSWESTELYYRLLNQTVRDRLPGPPSPRRPALRLGVLRSARCLVLSVDFAEIERLQVAGDWARAGELLAADAKVLEAAGADLVLLCTNTMHKVADALTAVLGVPLLHIGEVTADAVHAAGVRRVGL